MLSRFSAGLSFLLYYSAKVTRNGDYPSISFQIFFIPAEITPPNFPRLKFWQEFWQFSCLSIVFFGRKGILINLAQISQLW
jgi:hypothetical protein